MVQRCRLAGSVPGLPNQPYFSNWPRLPLDDHLPTAGQPVGLPPIDPPLGRKRRLSSPAARSCRRRPCAHVVLVPDVRRLRAPPPRSCLLAVRRSRCADQPLRSFAGQARPRRPAPGCRPRSSTIASPSGQQVEQEVLAGQFGAWPRGSRRRRPRCRRRRSRAGPRSGWGPRPPAPSVPSRASVLTNVCPIASENRRPSGLPSAGGEVGVDDHLARGRSRRSRRPRSWPPASAAGASTRPAIELLPVAGIEFRAGCAAAEHQRQAVVQPARRRRAKRWSVSSSGTLVQPVLLRDRLAGQAAQPPACPYRTDATATASASSWAAFS